METEPKKMLKKIDSLLDQLVANEEKRKKIKNSPFLVYKREKLEETRRQLVQQLIQYQKALAHTPTKTKLEDVRKEALARKILESVQNLWNE